MLGLIWQLRAQRIAWPIRKPRNNADECHCAEPRRDGAQLPTARAICRRAARPWGLPRASRRLSWQMRHLIPESLRRGHAGLMQRFPNQRARGCRSPTRMPARRHLALRFVPEPGKLEGRGSMAIEVKEISLWDTLRLQLFVSFPAFLLGLVAANRWVVSYVSRHGAGRSTMRFFRDLRDKYRCDHLWVWFPGLPVGRTLLVFAPETMESVLLSDANAADPFLKKRALSRFIPDALVISSGDEWRDRRDFNEEALYTGKLHRHHDAFKEIVFREAEHLTRQRARELRW